MDSPSRSASQAVPEMEKKRLHDFKLWLFKKFGFLRSLAFSEKGK